MITENTLRVKLEVAGDGQMKASLLDNAGALDTLEKSQEAVTEAAGAMAEAQKQATAATDAAGETAEQAAARIRAMVQASRERAEAERAAGEASQRSTQATASATVGLDRLVQAQNRAMAGATRMMQEEQRAAQAAAQAEGIAKQRDDLEKLVGQIDPTVAALHRLDVQQQQLKDFHAAGVLGTDDYRHFNSVIDASRDRITAAGEAMHSFSLNNANARRELGYIVKDLATGQFGRAQQSFLTLANASGLMQLAFSGVGAVVGATVAGLALFGVEAGKGAAEALALDRAVIATGESAGVTTGQVRAMAATIRGDGATALQLLVDSGRVSGERLEEAGQAAIDYAQVTGRSIQQAAAALVSLQDDPLRAAQELDKQLHFLTATEYENIRALQEMGDTSAAAAIAQTALAQDVAAKAAEQREHLTLLGRAWREVADAIDAAADAAKRYGREAVYGSTNTDDLAQANRQLDAIRRRSPQLGGLSDAQLLAAARTPGDRNHALLAGDLGTIQMAVATKQRSAAGAWFEGVLASTQAERDRSTSTLKDDDTFFDNLLKQAKSDQAKAREIASINERTQQDIAAAPNRRAEFEARQKEALAAVDKKYANKAAASVDRASLQADVDAFRTAQKQIDDIYANSGRTLEGELRAGLIDEQDYYQQRVKLINEHAAKLDASLAKEADALRQHKGNATEQIRIEQQLRDVEAKRAQAEQDADAQRKQADNDHLAAQRQLLEINRQVALSLQTYQRSREVAAGHDIASIGHGQDYAQQAQIRDQLRSQADARRDELTKQYRKAGALDSPQYKQGMEEIDQWEREQTQREVGYWNQRKEAMGDWRNGARAALEDFKTQAEDVAGTVREGLGGMYSDLMDDTVAWARGNHASFKNVEKDFEDMLARMVARALWAKAESALLGWIGGGGASGFSSLGGSAAEYSSIGSDGSFSGSFDFAGASGGGYATGGRVSGPGTGTSDDVIARLSNGENVITAQATNYYGQRFMDDLNAMRLPRFAQGGPVGTPRTYGGSGDGKAPIININRAEPGDRVDSRQDSDGRWVLDAFLAAASQDVARGGPLGQSIAGAFGLRRQARSYAPAGG
ncbi:MAG TPA: phage tail length tape measure family protein [Frateuria sp.]|uniref:phage tail length tape measure family protein n=1 Tax=Frateuria sp. TaxID=2211372 RepID=UPI002D7F0D65|nr:phage tail length tape measure family protein [Frateuria sp.]HET6805327.1 phage tail length tape measure family protein [Frateuria sp.]